MPATWKKLAFDTDVVKHSLADVANDFLVASGPDAFVKKTLAETKEILLGTTVTIYCGAKRGSSFYLFADAYCGMPSLYCGAQV
jgi:hypothetical protein